jgi:hypothetical protein
VKSELIRPALKMWAYGGVPAVYVAFVVIATLRADPLPPFGGVVGYWATCLFIALIVTGTIAVWGVAPRNRAFVAVAYVLGMSLVLFVGAAVGSIAAGDIH